MFLGKTEEVAAVSWLTEEGACGGNALFFRQKNICRFSPSAGYLGKLEEEEE